MKNFPHSRETDAVHLIVYFRRFTMYRNVKYPAPVLSRFKTCPASFFFPSKGREPQEDLLYPLPLLYPALSFFRTPLVLRQERRYDKRIGYILYRNKNKRELKKCILSQFKRKLFRCIKLFYKDEKNWWRLAIENAHLIEIFILS